MNKAHLQHLIDILHEVNPAHFDMTDHRRCIAGHLCAVLGKKHAQDPDWKYLTLQNYLECSHNFAKKLYNGLWSDKAMGKITRDDAIQYLESLL